MSYPARMVNGQLQVRVGADRWRKGIERKCAGCGYPFYRPADMSFAHHEGPGAGSYCTQMCWQKNGRKDMPRKTAVRVCEVCLDVFEVPRSKAKRYRSCGKPACAKEMRRRVALEKHERGAFAPRGLTNVIGSATIGDKETQA